MTEQPLNVALVQLSSGQQISQNLATVSSMVRQAAEDGARWVLLPENFAFLSDNPGGVEGSEAAGGGPVQQAMSQLAAALSIYLLLGGLKLRAAEPGRCYNSALLLDPTGAMIGRYDKMHLFDVAIAGEAEFTESAGMAAGSQAVVGRVDGTTIGLSICYDLRFPELYRRLSGMGAQVLTVPAAFTSYTGAAHWHTLLRARAIENQAFVLAPAQAGRHSAVRESYGHSLVISPWGEVLAEGGPEAPEIIHASLDLAMLARTRRQMPCLSHRRLS